jgi:hypothetical protein
VLENTSTQFGDINGLKSLGELRAST